MIFFTSFFLKIIKKIPDIIGRNNMIAVFDFCDSDDLVVSAIEV